MATTYTLDEQTYRQVRSLLSALASEAAGQEDSGFYNPIDLSEMIERSAPFSVHSTSRYMVDLSMKVDVARATYTYEDNELEDLDDLDD